MPRTPAKIRKRYEEGLDILDSETEEAFIRGEGMLGTPIELRTLEDWKRLWSRWRDVVMPKCLEYLPGVRPFACYVCGEIDPPPLGAEPPKTNGFFRVYIPSLAGTGEWFHRYPEPYQRDETRHLRGLGIVSDHEYRRYRQRMRDGSMAGLIGYPFEQGRYE